MWAHPNTLAHLEFVNPISLGCITENLLNQFLLLLLDLIFSLSRSISCISCYSTLYHSLVYLNQMIQTKKEIFTWPHLAFEKPQQHPYCHHGQRAACAETGVYQIFIE